VAQELVDSSGFLLARLGATFKTQAVARMEEAGYDTYDYSVLAILAEGAREAQATIAGALGLDPGRLVALLDSLEQRGLVTRQRDPQDRRRHVVSITDIGQDEHQRLRQIIRQLEDDFFAPLDQDSRKRFHAALLQLAAYHDPSCGQASDARLD
jgi:DNA-binding MarR family transcriptional regulator